MTFQTIPVENCSVHLMVVNDDHRLVRHYLARYPGSAHDARVCDATRLAQKPEEYFEDRYYLTGDPVVSAFHIQYGRVTTEEEKIFNTHMGESVFTLSTPLVS